MLLTRHAGFPFRHCSRPSSCAGTDSTGNQLNKPNQRPEVCVTKVWFQTRLSGIRSQRVPRHFFSEHPELCTVSVTQSTALPSTATLSLGARRLSHELFNCGCHNKPSKLCARIRQCQLGFMFTRNRQPASTGAGGAAATRHWQLLVSKISFSRPEEWVDCGLVSALRAAHVGEGTTKVGDRAVEHWRSLLRRELSGSSFLDGSGQALLAFLPSPGTSSRSTGPTVLRRPASPSPPKRGAIDLQGAIVPTGVVPGHVMKVLRLFGSAPPICRSN